MEHEQEEQADLFHDSWHRLSWVERQTEAVRTLAEPWLRLPRRASLQVQIDEERSKNGHLEFSVEAIPVRELPADVNFLVGNIVTDARSCLDMAIDSIWNHYELKRNRVHVQFPLEDDFGQKREEKRHRLFLERLNEEFVAVIEEAQPNYFGGIVDIPGNVSAIFIRELSNANKHRNITPAAVRINLSSYGTCRDGLKLRTLDSTERSGVDPIRFSLDYDTTLYSTQEAQGFVAGAETPRSAPLHIDLDQRFVVDRQEISLYPPRMGRNQIHWRTELESLITKVPAYVRLTLRNLNRAHSFIENGTERRLVLDFDGTL